MNKTFLDLDESFLNSYRQKKIKVDDKSLIYLDNTSMVNTICINSFRYTHVLTSTKFRLKQTWRLTKAIAKMKCDTEQTMKLQ